MKHTLTAAVLLLCASVAQAELKDAVGVIGRGCTCVVVTPDGYVLTAEHCGVKDGDTVELNGRDYKASMIYQPQKNGFDEAVLLKIDSEEPLPFAPVALSGPRPGDVVTSIGFPNGKFSRATGEVLSVSSNPGTPNRTGTTHYAVQVNFGSAGGNSGGPIFNVNGEVVGLTATTSPDGTRCIGWPSIKQSTNRITLVQRFQRKPHVLYFGFDGCPGCAAVERDMKAGLLDDIDIEYVDVGTIEGKARWDALNAAIERANPTYVNQNAFPAFHREGEATIVFGYGLSNGSPRILKWLLETIRLPLTLTEGILGLIYPKSSGPVLAPAPLEEPPLLDPPPAPIATPSPKDPPKDPKIEPKGEPDPPDLPVPAPDPEEEDSPLLVMLLAAGAALVEMFAGKKVKS